MRIFLTGGTGLVGSLLTKRLCERGDHVVLLSRRPDAAKTLGDGVTVVTGDPMQTGPWMDAVADCDAVVHLAGEGIFNRRWSQEFKDLIHSSRIKSTANIVAALARSSRPGRTLVSASAVGWYGPHGDEELTEDSGPGGDFLAKVCIDWEKAAEPATAQGVRVVLLRTGIVLDKNGGALGQMLTPFKLFVGGPVGSGKQWMSWIHNEDEVGLILFALDHPEISGPFNASAPIPVTNRDFSTALGTALGRPSFFPTPGFMLRIMLGESAEIVTNGQRVLPKKALAAGYDFKFKTIYAALGEIFAS
jgi:uncharacterized protein (TIGR01777 family)